MNITSAKALAHVLNNERKQRKLTQHDIAELIGVRQPTVSSFENGPEGTRLDTLFKLLAALDLELQVMPRNRISAEVKAWDQEW